MLKYNTYTVYANKICISFLQIVRSVAYQQRQTSYLPPLGLRSDLSLNDIPVFANYSSEQLRYVTLLRGRASPDLLVHQLIK